MIHRSAKLKGPPRGTTMLIQCIEMTFETGAPLKQGLNVLVGESGRRLWATALGVEVVIFPKMMLGVAAELQEESLGSIFLSSLH